MQAAPMLPMKTTMKVKTTMRAMSVLRRPEEGVLVEEL
jgi:predicted nuclease with RNAse H fold